MPAHGGVHRSVGRDLIRNTVTFSGHLGVEFCVAPPDGLGRMHRHARGPWYGGILTG
jgi:hypothetical protein